MRTRLVPSGVALVVAITAALLVPSPARATLTDVQEAPEGTVLGKDNWKIAEGLLPPEILELYKKGEYSSPIRKLEGKKGTIYSPELVEASKKNAGKFRVDENGTVIDVDTGERPDVIIGWPFPDIDANDPQAGAKVMWNYLYTLYWAGSFHTESPINWISRDSGILRRISVDVHFKYYDGQPPPFQEKIGENDLNILSRTMALVREPADVEGIVSLNWRYREGDKQDQAWSYVPALRRVRPINPANRADGFLGSDISQDDGPYFDGKPEDFNFKLIGEGYMLGTFENDGLEDPGKPVPLTENTEISDLIDGSDTGWRVSYPNVDLIASQDESWKPGEGLVAWAPTYLALIPRPVWIVEAVPKNPYYLYGKQIMYFDKESFRGYWKSKFDWKGSVLANWQLPESLFQKVEGGPIEYMRMGKIGGAGVMNNFKQDRATVSGLPTADTEWYVDLPDEIFETSRIIREGK
ncbi:MAG: DUF1329 domain-containing protein [Deltaproteobacteria bacterium]|nr:DUF1329 domain-containing protein [Deltaproteobacteria bacterium]